MKEKILYVWNTNKKLILAGIGIIVVIIVAFVLNVVDKKAAPIEEQTPIVEKNPDIASVSDPVLAKASVNLSPSMRTFFEKRIVDTQKKIASFTDATSIKDRIDYAFVLAVDQQALGDYDLAQKTLIDAIRLDPKNPYLHQTYAVLYWDAGQRATARKEINKAIELKSDEVNFWRTKIDYNVGAKTDIMEQIYANALSATNRNIDMITLYARFQEKIGNKQKAITLWKEAQVAYPPLSATYQSEIDRLTSM